MSDLLAELVEAARDDAPAEGTVTRSLGELEAAVASGQAPLVDPHAAHPLAEALTASASSSVTLKVLIVALLAGSSATAIISSREAASPPVAAAVPPHRAQAIPDDNPPPRSPEPEARPQPEPVTAQTPDEALLPEAPPPEPRSSTKSGRTGGDIKPRVRPEPSASDFAEETRLLTRAWAAIRRGALGEALRLASEHRRRFPDGRLVEEREASRVVALCGLGKASAKNARARFLARFPGSVHAERVRGACTSDDRTKIP